MAIKYLVKDRSTGRTLSRHIKLSNARKAAVARGRFNNAIRIYTVKGVQIA